MRYIHCIVLYCIAQQTQEIGVTHLRIAEGVATFVQLTGLLARLCRLCEAKPLAVQAKPWLTTPEGD